MFSLYSKAQEYNYFHYDIKDGLSGINIYAIAQDKDGFLWFGTETGLSRFDGSHFRNYGVADGLNDNEIINLFVDSKNRVWIFPFSKTIYYYYQGKIHNSSNDSLIRKFNLKNEIFKACEDKDGNICFLETDRLHILSESNALTEITEINGKDFFNDGAGVGPNGNINLFISYKEDIANHRINSFECKNSRLIFKNQMQDYNLSRNTVEINPKYTVLRNAGFFEVFNKKNNTQYTIKVPENFHSISYIDDSSFAICSTEKTFLFNVNQKKIIDSFLAYKIVNKTFKDNENNLWLATTSFGIYRLASTKFDVYTLENNFNSMPVYTLNRINNNLYIGSSKILLWKLNLNANTLEKLKILTDYNIGRISSIQFLLDSTIILASDNGIFILHGKKIINYYARTSIKNIFLYKGDSLILATDRSVYNLRINDTMHVDTIWKSRATCAYKFNDEYYVGTLSGLYVIKKNGRDSAINLGKMFPSLEEKIIAIARVSDTDFWIATGNNGLVYLSNNKVKYQITIENGLRSNECRCLYIDKKNLWLGTDKGICKIDLSSYPFKINNYTTADGLDCEIINCIYAEGDSVFAGTPFGLTFFEASKIQNQSICKIKLTDVKSNDSNWYNNIHHIFLKANDNSISFEYAGISFLSDGDVTYYYQLNGLDTTWESTKEDSVEFERLPAGEYTFSIYAVNKYGAKSETISIAFKKAKHFWESWWLQGVAIILIGFSVWLIFRMRLKMVRKSANEKVLHERKIHELEQMALRAQMNPHFIFNSLNSIQQYVFSGNVAEANQFITNFSSLIRQTLYISGKKFITVSEEIKYLESYLTIEQSKYENIFDFVIETNDCIVMDDTLIPPLILQPYIENSIRHGILNLKDRKGKIDVHFSLKNDQLVCTVKDNGIGRKASSELKQGVKSEHKSKGMELVKSRIESLNAIYNVSITVFMEDITDVKEKGTYVTIKFPLNYADS